MLGIRFTPGSIAARSPIGQSLNRVLKYHNQKNISLRDYELGKTALLVKELKIIEQHDSELLATFKKQLHTNLSFDKYFGFRMEIHTAAVLILKKVEFTKTESPDFTIHTEDRDVFIECGSAHLSKPKTQDVKYKIGSVISQKSKKPYCGPATALFIDYTNIYHNILKNDSQFKTDEINEYLKNALKTTKFGNITLTSYVAIEDTKRFAGMYIRVDNQNIDKSLLNTLDKSHPHGKYTIDKLFVFSEC